MIIETKIYRKADEEFHPTTLLKKCSTETITFFVVEFAKSSLLNTEIYLRSSCHVNIFN